MNLFQIVKMEPTARKKTGRNLRTPEVRVRRERRMQAVDETVLDKLPYKFLDVQCHSGIAPDSRR
jgi:hypothetical protein